MTLPAAPAHTSATTLKFVSVAAERSDVIALIHINRPEMANAFNDAVIRELIARISEASSHAHCRAIVLRGKGKHFSAGADLAWMQASARLSFNDNIKDAHGLIELFETLGSTPLPTLAVITGSAFGGAVGLAAACDVAIASEDAKFSLSEIKLGLLPAVILPYLARKMRPGSLRRLALTGRLFDAREAKDIGLLERVASHAELPGAIREEINGFLQGSPTAQAELKRLMHHVTTDSLRQGVHTAEAIATMRTSPSGQAGLAAFFAKQQPPWSITLPPDFRCED